MAFDQATRNRLAKFVGDARSLLTEEFTRQLQHEYGLDPLSGEVTPLEKLTALDDARRETARILRETLDYYLSNDPHPLPLSPERAKGALERIVREQAFTVLNRLCALRMAEARGFLIESVGRGYQSTGFQLYARLAGAALGETGETYRSYLFSIFDEFALDLPVLFDRFSPQGRLFPREGALLRLLERINDPEIAPLWAEDETIGWVYQYFNSKGERQKMRAESQAPRNSRELAVRNQFFTPRYVVEFLTDNTLGRIWYEMTRGETALKDTCRYLVRRPNEIFLGEGEEAPEQSESGEDLSQEELLRQPVYISHRPLKDPREIKLLDPACGSMHFGLYAFDLFERIYEEAWELEERLGENALWRMADLAPLHQTYADKAAFLRDVPRLIIERNLHGIDIDPRAVQIAGLSLWLRAQKSWQAQGLKPHQRPQIRKANIVCAEPMPGDRQMLEEFLSMLRGERLEALMRKAWHVPADQKVRATPQMAEALAKLVRRIWQEMELAGEAGSLLKIEETLRDEIAAARREAEEKSPLFRVLEYGLNEPGQEQYVQMVAGEEQDFFDRAEGLVLAALKDYAEQAVNGSSFLRRLFAGDAAQGFTFINLCRKSYDLVLMNPPFGEATKNAFDYYEKNYTKWNRNILCCFLERMHQKSEIIASVYDRTIAVKATYEDFRRSILLSKAQILTITDLGWGVLDANVEVSTVIFSRRVTNMTARSNVFFDVKDEPIDQKGPCILNACIDLAGGSIDPHIFFANPDFFTSLPNAVLGFYFLPFVRRIFSYGIKFEDTGSVAFKGHDFKADQHFRLFWEIILGQTGDLGTAIWSRVFNGGEWFPYYHISRDTALYGENGSLIKNNPYVLLRNEQYQGLPGIGYGKRGDFLDAQIVRQGHAYTAEGIGVRVNEQMDAFFLASLMNSKLFQYVINLYCGQHKSSSYVNLFPIINFGDDVKQELIENAKQIWIAKFNWQLGDETDPIFTCPRLIWNSGNELTTLLDNLLELEMTVNSEIKLLSEKRDSVINQVYELNEEAINEINKVCKNMPFDELWLEGPKKVSEKRTLHLTDFLSVCIGWIWGRWDIRCSKQHTPNPILFNPFASLPVCPPGMLQNAQGLPAAPEDVPADYPLRITWGGILVDDEGHPEDIEARLREALRVVWGERAEAIEAEACQILGVRSLREYFRKPTLFFADHLKRYSKSRRQAPIYWQLSTPSCSYSLWLYYHRLSDQTLFTCVNDFVDPRLQQVAEEIARLRQRRNRTPAEEKELERLMDFEGELKDFRAELLRVAAFWKPNLNDGVQITAAPLWKLFQHKPWQKKLKETWEKLERGDYDWAHLAYSIWPERVREKCKTDKSLAIAHGLEELYLEPEEPFRRKGKPKKKPSDDEEDWFDEA